MRQPHWRRLSSPWRSVKAPDNQINRKSWSPRRPWSVHARHKGGGSCATSLRRNYPLMPHFASVQTLPRASRQEGSRSYATSIVAGALFVPTVFRSFFTRYRVKKMYQTYQGRLQSASSAPSALVSEKSSSYPRLRVKPSCSYSGRPISDDQRINRCILRRCASSINICIRRRPIPWRRYSGAVYTLVTMPRERCSRSRLGDTGQQISTTHEII